MRGISRRRARRNATAPGRYPIASIDAKMIANGIQRISFTCASARPTATASPRNASSRMRRSVPRESKRFLLSMGDLQGPRDGAARGSSREERDPARRRDGASENEGDCEPPLPGAGDARGRESGEDERERVRGESPEGSAVGAG